MELHEIKKELEKDFKNEVSKIDFCNYNPASREFMSPLSIGMMIMVLDEAEKTESPIEEEIDGAREYAHQFKKTGRAEYRSMASDELRHASILASLHNKDISEYDTEMEEVRQMLT